MIAESFEEGWQSKLLAPIRFVAAKPKARSTKRWRFGIVEGDSECFMRRDSDLALLLLLRRANDRMNAR